MIYTERKKNRKIQISNWLYTEVTFNQNTKPAKTKLSHKPKDQISLIGLPPNVSQKKLSNFDRADVKVLRCHFLNMTLFSPTIFYFS